MPSQLTFQSPAKINLFLKVINKREDGYHNIHTLFHRINLCDELTFDVKPGDEMITIDCDTKGFPKGRHNLIYQAAHLLKEMYPHKPLGAHITVKKNIPMAAGLGGGSSNAATTLRALNIFWNLNLKTKDLLEIGKILGADVGFFLNDISFGLGHERGDELLKVNIRKKFWFVLVTPKKKITSKEAYSRLKLKLTKKKPSDNIQKHFEKYKDPSVWFFNDLEKSIFEISPGVKKLKKALSEFNPLGVLVSGSGPTVYAVVSSEKEAKHIYSEMIKSYSQVFIARTL